MKPFVHNNEFEKNKRVNTLPFRSHYIPFKVEEEFSFIHGVIDKTKSSLFTSLNGKWLFKEHKCIDDIKYIDEELNDSIDVPSCVQCRGYNYYQYTNFKYPIPFNPPFVPKENPVFHYRKEVELHIKEKAFLVFEGVDSAFYLFINNVYVGYSQISHSKSEFDISGYIKDGNNVIDVFVLKWCASTYLEDQDKFRFTGIFRDVYILSREEKHIWDYKIEPLYQDNEWFIKITNLSNVNFQYQIGNQTGYVNKEAIIKVDNPILWNENNPHLYDVILFTQKEKILERVGLRKVEINDGVFLINNEHIKLRGVNRHESSPYNGATVTIEEAYKDLTLIKSISANAIRTSHYPDIPEFYELCDILGIYVVNEADVESHGAALDEYSLQKWQDFANSGLYDDAVFDREVSLYERDKNRTCVIIWSLGNESNYGQMFFKGADYIHEHDNRPIHYEGIFNMVDKSDYYTDRIDICSRMYPSIKDIQKQYLDDKKEKRPLLICEYSHSMGNSCGDVFDYWKMIMSSKRITGAFIWEWCDHAVIIDNQLKYGSDFPEHHNDGYFCVDGLVTPLREFKSNALEVKSVYEHIDSLKEIELIDNIKPFKPLLDDNPVNACFDDKNASVCQLSNLLAEPISLCFTRADIDNEMHDKEKINEVRTAHLVVKEIKEMKNGKEYHCVLTSKEDKPLIDLNVKYKACNGGVLLSLSYSNVSDCYLSRIGFKFAVKENNHKVKYFGLGEEETYVDKHHYAKMGHHEYIVNELKPIYLKPQEYGHHHFVSELSVGDIKVTANKAFSFNVLPYSEEQLLNTKHNYELLQDGNTYINIDYYMSGVGSHSCGPVLEEKYKTPKIGEIEFFLSI